MNILGSKSSAMTIYHRLIRDADDPPYELSWMKSKINDLQLLREYCLASRSARGWQQVLGSGPEWPEWVVSVNKGLPFIAYPVSINMSVSDWQKDAE